MAIQDSTFTPLPQEEDIELGIERQMEHIEDLTSYLCYLIPLAEKVGDRVYDVAANSLNESGLAVTAAELRELAAELTSPEGEETYRDARLRHCGLFLTSTKGVVR